MGSGSSKSLRLKDAVASPGERTPGTNHGDTCRTQVPERRGRPTADSTCAGCHNAPSAFIKWCPFCEKSLCATCLKFHRRNPKTCRHPTVDLTGNQNTTRSQLDRKDYDVCDRHPHDVNLLCDDCMVAICQVCREQQHARCKSVHNLDSKYPDMRLYLLDYKSKLKMHIDVREAQQAYAEPRASTLLQMYREREQAINQTLTSGPVLNIAGMCRVYLSCLSGDAPQTATVLPKLSDAIFNPDTAALLLSRFSTKQNGLPECAPVFSSALRSPIQTRDEVGEDINILCDIKVMAADGFETAVVSDLSNKCLKSFYTAGKEVFHSKLELDGPPHSIALLLNQQVLVAVPGKMQIVRVKILPDLVLLATVKTKRRYSGLTVLSPTSVAAGSWKCVDILDMAGYLLRSIVKCNGEAMVGRPWYMCANSGNLIVSDWEKKSVICFTTAGKVVWRYPPNVVESVRAPLGVAVTSTGDVLVSDWGGQEVVCLSGSGVFKKTVPYSQNGVHNVRGLCVDHKNTVFVCGKGQIHRLSLTRA